ncbi:inositol monophosphatase family protein [Aureimonas populi]|uniref:Inositol monophosphatase family protein n=1 Tax=Aureimonas populi TaxID=1701758 RepID=A0ABW5CJE4_9HYPH|nr:inositol monophosphatase family protein [Aureimonas populi]
MTASDFTEIEALAFELASLAGAQIESSLGRTLAVRYKKLSEDEAAVFKDPVSEVDHAVEVLLRARLADKFPDHAIIGEEVQETAGTAGFTWVIDPVDGTANFINGFPLFAASIGVVFEGRPVVGAVWCSTSHALRSGVYHAREGGPLYFEESRIETVDRGHVRRRLVGLPHVLPAGSSAHEGRQTGSSAVECAFVAAGLLAGARFEAPNIWDVAGGIPLVQAMKGDVMTRESRDGAWARFSSFATDSGRGGIGRWKQGLTLGEPGTVAALTG